MAYSPEISGTAKASKNLPPLPPVNLEGTHILGQIENTTGSFKEVTTFVQGAHEQLGIPKYEDTLSNGPETVVVQRSVRPIGFVNIAPEEPW